MRCASLAVLAAVLLTGSLAAQMPDVRSMSGMAMPSPDLPDGTVTVRVVRGEITNNLAGVSVELHGAGAARTAVTGSDGRATFSGVPAGSTVHARAVVEGEPLESSTFQVPARGGIRTLLAASAGGSGTSPAPADGAAAAPPASSGTAATAGPLALTPNSRIAIEFSNDILQVFYLFEIANRSGGPLALDSPLVFDLPEGALGATVMEGSTRQAVAEGDRVIVTGPVPAGNTELQIAFRLDAGGGTLRLQQTFPVPAEMVLMAVQKFGEMRLSSPQLTRVQEAPIQSSTFMIGSGPALPAGAMLDVTITGLPHHSRTPLWIALALVAIVLGAGVWLSTGPGAASAHQIRRRALERQREDGLAALAALEADRRAGRIGQHAFEARRSTLVAALERVYGELDAESAAPEAERTAAA